MYSKYPQCHLPTQASSGFVSASDLLAASSGTALRTFQENLDALFGGPGIPLGTITGEILHVEFLVSANITAKIPEFKRFKRLYERFLSRDCR